MIELTQDVIAALLAVALFAVMVRALRILGLLLRYGDPRAPRRRVRAGGAEHFRRRQTPAM